MDVGTGKHLRPWVIFILQPFLQPRTILLLRSHRRPAQVLPQSQRLLQPLHLRRRRLFSFVVVRYTFGFVGFNFGLSSLLLTDFFAEGVDLALDIALGLIVSGIKRFGYFLGIVRITLFHDSIEHCGEFY